MIASSGPAAHTTAKTARTAHTTAKTADTAHTADTLVVRTPAPPRVLSAATEMAAAPHAGTTTATRVGAPRTLGTGWSVLLVLGTFAVMHVPLAVGFARSPIPQAPIDPYVSFWDSRTWGKYDTWIYLDIAKSGYSLEPCTKPGPFDADDWCGSAGWTPTYPALIRILDGSTPLTRDTSAFVLSRLCTLGVLSVLWFLVFKRRLGAASVSALLLASMWPGEIYLLALYPMSLAVLASLLTAVALARGRPVLAGCCAVVVATSHTTGVYIGVFVLVWIALEHRRELRTAARFAAGFLAPFAAGVAAMLAMFHLTTGRWDALVLTQHKYGHHFEVAPWFLLRRLSAIWSSNPGVPRAEVLQAWLVATLMVGVAVATFTRWRELAAVERILAVIALGFWILPLSFGGDNAAYYRVEILTLPGVVVLRRLPASTLLGLTAFAAIVSAALTKVYVQGLLS